MIREICFYLKVRDRLFGDINQYSLTGVVFLVANLVETIAGNFSSVLGPIGIKIGGSMRCAFGEGPIHASRKRDTKKT